MFDVVADELLIGGGVGGVLGLISIIKLSKLDFGIFNDFWNINRMFQSIRFRDDQESNNGNGTRKYSLDPIIDTLFLGK